MTKITKRVLAFDIDQTLNIAKTPIPPEIAQVLVACLDYFEICPISGQKFEQFLIQIVEPLQTAGVTAAQLAHLHLFVAQGTQYYRYNSPISTAGHSATRTEVNHKTAVQPTSDSAASVDPAAFTDSNSWQQIYNYPLSEADVVKITTVLEESARELGFWEADKLKSGDQIIENRLSQVTFSALGQAMGTSEKYDWDPDMKKRQAIVAKCQAKLPDFLYEIGGTTSINVAAPGMNKAFGMARLLEELKVDKADVLYFGDMTQPGGNDYPVVEMGIDTITVRSHEDTLYALQGILGLIGVTA